MARYTLPTFDDLRDLGEPQEYAITIYAETSPAPDKQEASFLHAKSAFDHAIRQLREEGARHATEAALRERFSEITNDEAWTRLSRSMAIFLAPERAELFVLPNALENQLQVGSYFDVGQLVRAVTTPQSAYALTLSASGWNLWEATATTIAAEMDLLDDHDADAAEANNRSTIRGRKHINRLAGDEGKKVLLETYAKRVAESVNSELGHVDPSADRPLFLFATDPLLEMYRGIDGKRRIVAIHGSPDELRADEIDSAIREHLGAINAEQTAALVDQIGDGTSQGLVVKDMVDISRAAAAGAVSTLVYNFTVDVLGTIDDSSGDITFTDDGYDLLSRIAMTVLDRGGEVIAVRPDEVTSSLWNQTAIARLRYALS